MLDIKFIKNENPKPIPGPEDPLVFGTIFTDHMFVMDYTEGKFSIEGYSKFVGIDENEKVELYILVNNEEHIIAVLDLTHPNITFTVAGIASILPSTPTTNNIDVDIGNNLPNSQKPPFWKKPNI